MIFVMAAESGEDELVAQYLEAGFNPNSRDHNSNTALMAASLNGHASTMMILLKASADPHLANDNGLNAIHFASIRGDRRAAEIMLAIYPAPRETASTRR
jgi:ankyrin repeat protein